MKYLFLALAISMSFWLISYATRFRYDYEYVHGIYWCDDWKPGELDLEKAARCQYSDVLLTQ